MKTYNERTQSILHKAEVQQSMRETKRKKIIKLTSIISGALAFVLAVNLVLFVPYQTGGINITAYSGSEYYTLIKQLSAITHPTYKTNNFKQWFGALFDSVKGGDFAPDSPDSPNMSEANNNYSDVTLNQTENVTEGDLFKRSASHIFYLGYTPVSYDVIIDESENGSDKVIVRTESTYKLRAYSLAGENSELVIEYTIEPEDGTTFGDYANMREMFISADGKAVTVITPCFDNGTNQLLYTAVIRLDVSDLTEIKETQRIYVSGTYVSSRMADDSLLLISNFSVWRWNNDFSDEAKFVPQYGKLGELKSLPAADIVIPESVNTANYTVICSIDCDTLEATDALALLSYTNDVYVSQNNLFATRGFLQSYDADEKFDVPYSLDHTEIRIVSYGDGKLENAGSVTVDGAVLDRYSLDEYDGVLRAVTTATYRNASYIGTGVTEIDDKFPTVTCNLYCFDISSLESVASVERFAPLGEAVKSARFSGNTAYVCTAEIKYLHVIEITDPVFAFDLSDYDNITYKDTGTIPGYSLSLAEFYGGTLLGIGYGDNTWTLKIELYTQTDSNVSSVAQYELPDVNFSSRYKAHFIDKANGLVGLCVNDYTTGKTLYKLIRYDGYALNEILSIEINTDVNDARATCIDGNVYIFGDNDFKVIVN